MDDRTRALLAERKRRREAEEQRTRIAEVCSELRSFYYPKQAAFYRRSKAKRKTTRKTRRAGATTGGCRELLARALEQPGFRATYVATTRIEARARAWEGDTSNALADLVRRVGRLVGGDVETYDIGGVKVELRAGELALELSNGSRVDLFGADDERSINKARGLAKHVFWIDEAQDFTHLERFYKAVVVAALSDFDGECWVTGTPSRDCSGFFWDLTRDDGEPTLPGWEVHEFAAVDNPYFGATPEERDARTAQAALTENGWTPDDPDFLREWRAKWVKSDANYCYPVHAVPEHVLLYAPARHRPDGFPDIPRALEDLPGWGERDYFFAHVNDLGYSPDPYAFLVWAWSLQDPNLYEVASWKKTELDSDQQADIMREVRTVLGASMCIADAGGGGKQVVAGWSKKWVERYGIGIIEATKTNKHGAIEQMGSDIRLGRIKARRGGVWHAEAKVHRWATASAKTGKMVEGPTPNHVLDCGLYGHRESFHHRFIPVVDPTSGLTPDEKRAFWSQRVEEQLEISSTDEGDGWRW